MVQPEPTNPDPSSFLEILRAKRAEANQARFLELPVPGYENLLVVRYGKTLTWLQAKKAIDKASKNKDEYAQLWAMCDVLAQTVVGIYGRANEDDELVLISEHFDNALSDALGLGSTSARQTIRLIYGSDLTVGATQGRVMNWIQQVDEDSGTEISGNS